MTRNAVLMPSNGQLDSGLNQLFPTLIWRANAYADSDLSGIDSKVNAAIANAVRDACARDRAFKPADYPNGYTTYSSRFPLREDPRCAPLLYWILREAQVYFQHVGVSPGWRPVISDFFGTIGRHRKTGGLPFEQVLQVLSGTYEGPYGLGSERGLQDFERYSGLNFASREQTPESETGDYEDC